MAATYTLATLRTAILRRVDHETTGYFGTSELNEFVNDAAQKHHDLMISVLGQEYALKERVDATTVGVADHELPADFYRLVVLQGLTDIGWVPLQRYELQDRLIRTTNDWPDWMPRYHLMGMYGMATRLKIDPPPATQYDIKITYHVTAPVYVADGDVVGLPYPELLILDVAIKCMHRQRKDAAELIAERTQLRADIEALHAPQDRQSPPETIDRTSRAHWPACLRYDADLLNPPALSEVLGLGIAIGENLLPNTQWQVASGLLSDTKFNKEGTGTFPPINVASYTTGTVGSTVCTVGAGGIGDLKVDDIGNFSAAAHANLKICACRVTAVAGDGSTFTVGLPLGRTGTSSAACTFTPISIGGNNSGSTGDAFDGWSKDAAALVWRDDYSVNVKDGSAYSCGFKKSVGTLQSLYVTVPARDLPRYRGKRVCFGVWVLHKIKGGAGTWRVNILTSGDDYASATATSTDWTWLEATGVVPTGATSLTFAIEFDGASSDVYYVSQPIAVLGQFLGENNYSQPRNEYLIPLVHVQFASFLDSDPDLPSSLSAATGKGNDTELIGNTNDAFKAFTIDPYAETNGAIAPTVREIVVKLEGRCESESDAWGISSNNQAAGAHVFGPLLYSVRGGFMMSPQKAGAVLDANGRCYSHSALISLTGTMDFTNGSATVTGTGTRFLTELSNGQLIKQNTGSGNKFYRIKARASDTSLTLGVPAGADATFDEGTALGASALKINANWFNFAMEANGVWLS